MNNKVRKLKKIFFKKKLQLHHGCHFRNRNRTRKQIDSMRGQNCLLPIDQICWREAKPKYLFQKNYYTRNRRKALTDISILCPSCKPDCIEYLSKGKILETKNVIDRERATILKERFRLKVDRNFIVGTTA